MPMWPTRHQRRRLEWTNRMRTPIRRYYRGATQTAIRDVQAATTHYFHYDQQGTTQCLTNSTLTVTDRFASNAWGQQVRRSGSSSNRHWYIGNWGYTQGREQGLDYVRARYYKPNAGQWIAQDPIRPRNLTYVYASNMPSVRVDASGLIDSWDDNYDESATIQHPGTTNHIHWIWPVEDRIGRQGLCWPANPILRPKIKWNASSSFTPTAKCSKGDDANNGARIFVYQVRILIIGPTSPLPIFQRWFGFKDRKRRTGTAERNYDVNDQPIGHWRPGTYFLRAELYGCLINPGNGSMWTYLANSADRRVDMVGHGPCRAT